jgi:hypothetical protein
VPSPEDKHEHIGTKSRITTNRLEAKNEFAYIGKEAHVMVPIVSLLLL